MRHNPALVAALLLLLLGGGPVARGDDKPTSPDLGKIQPPGGVPLPVVGTQRRIHRGRPGQGEGGWRPYPKTTSRSGSANWNGSSARNSKTGCRCKTGLPHRLRDSPERGVRRPRVGRQAADALLKRAQTMPASEAKVWKEVFEAVLKKEIGQTDTGIHAGGPAWAVTLVLVPVDALHEGPKYSAERGRKYGPAWATDRGGRRPLEGPGGPIRGHPPRRRGQPHPRWTTTSTRNSSSGPGSRPRPGRASRSAPPRVRTATAVDPLDLLGPPKGCTG